MIGDSKKIYITKQGFENLRAEYSQLLNVERPALVETVAWAAGNGDRSENGDYIYGKRRLRQIDGRLLFLKKRLEAAVVVDVSTVKSTRVVFGATVHLEDEDGQTKIYQLVGEDEVSAQTGRVSWKSPMGQALLGKQVDDEIAVRSPSGEKVYVLLRIEFVDQPQSLSHTGPRLKA
jgi:transcription elongation factor GreB